MLVSLRIIKIIINQSCYHVVHIYHIFLAYIKYILDIYFKIKFTRKALIFCLNLNFRLLIQWTRWKCIVQHNTKKGDKMSNKEAYYFKHFYNARNDRKIKKARLQLGIEAYAIFFMILEVLREQQDFRYPLEDLDVLADDLDVSIQKVEVIVKNYGLFVIDENENFFSVAQINSLKPWIELREANRLKGIKSGIARRNKIEEDINKLSQVHSSKQRLSGGLSEALLLYSNIEYNNTKYSTQSISTNNQKDYFKFIEQMREKYRGNSNKNYHPLFFQYGELDIAIDSIGKLYAKNKDDDLSTGKAIEIWEYIYKNQDKIIPLEQHKKSQLETNNKEDEAYINDKVKNLLEVKKF